MRYLTLIGAAYSFLCLCFLGLRLGNRAASHLFGYTFLLCYLFTREFCHVTGHPLYPFLALFRGVIFLMPFLMWASTLSLMGKEVSLGLRNAALTWVGALCLLDLLYVRPHRAHLAYVFLELTAAVLPVLASALAFRKARSFASVYGEAFPNQGKQRLRWLEAYVTANLLLSLLFLVEGIVQLKGLGFRYLGLLVTGVVQFGFVLFTTRDSAGLFDEAALKTVSELEPRQRMTLPEATLESLSRKFERLFDEEKVFLDPDLDLESVSARLGERPDIVSRFVRQSQNRSFKELVNHFRIRHCLEVLRKAEGKKNILEAAFESGFNSKATFYRYFDKVVGCSPKDYLATSRQEQGWDLRPMKV